MPVDPHQLIVFLVAALTLNLTPGNDMMYVIGQSLGNGRRAGIAASLGIACGSLVHIALVAAGMAALLDRFPAVFEVIRWAGVIYLLWLAWKAFNSGGPAATAALQSRSAFAVWRDGVIVNILNPKVAVFMLAFLPQFVDVSRGSPVVQIVFLGLIFNLGGTIVLLLVSLGAGRLGEKLSTSTRIARAFAIASGSILLALAAKLAVDRR